LRAFDFGISLFGFVIWDNKVSVDCVPLILEIMLFVTAKSTFIRGLLICRFWIMLFETAKSSGVRRLFLIEFLFQADCAKPYGTSCNTPLIALKRRTAAKRMPPFWFEFGRATDLF